MADKQIKVVDRITNIFGRPHLFVQQDSITGNPIVDPDDSQKYMVRQGSTLDLIERLIEHVPRWAFRKGDSEHMASIMLAVRGGGDVLTLSEEDYYWLGELIERQMPDPEGGDAHHTVGMTVWGTNEAHFISLLESE